MEKAVIYARVSSREQESGYSLPAQEKLLREYSEKQKLKIAKVFSVSESASGKKQRETFGEMMIFAVKNNIKHILCEKTDRLTRNMHDAVTINRWIHDNADRKVHFVKENVVLHKESKSNEKFIWNIKVSVAQYYIDNLGEEVRKGQLSKLEAGYLPYQPKFGYKSARLNDKNIHIVNEQEGVYLIRMYELYSTGNFSLNALRQRLYQEGMRNRRGNSMHISRIAAILADPFYYGALRWKGKTLNNMGKHTPLVSRQLFDRVQLVLQGKSAPKYSKHFFAFKKMLNCANCGGTMTGEIQKGKVYYRCKGYGGCKVKSSIREDEIERQILGAFEIFRKLTDTEQDQVRQAILELYKEDSEYREKSLEKLIFDRQRLESQRDMLYEDKLTLRISLEKWETKDKEYENRIVKVEEAITKQHESQTTYFKVGSSLVELALKAEKLYQQMTPEKQRDLLKLIFANLRVDNKKVLFSFVKPVETLVKRIEDKLVAETIFHRQKTVTVQSSNQFSTPFYSLMCALQDDFRTLEWPVFIQFPDLILGDIENLYK